MGRLFNFNSLITPSIIKFLFYIGVAVSVLTGLVLLVSGVAMMQWSPMLGLGYIIAAVAVALIGIVISRVYAEIILVAFMIRDELAWQRQQRQGNPAE